MTSGKITVSILAENTAQGVGLLGEHGLSLWIETPETSVLFDTGQGLALPHNADMLGIDVGCADAIVLSHGHYDHTGGLAYVLDQNKQARLFMHSSAPGSRFSIHNGKARANGMPAEAGEAVNARLTSIIWTREPTEVASGIFVTGPIPRLNDFEDTGGPFYLNAAGTVPDPIEDDQALWIETPDGLIVLLGCAHAGVVNTLVYILKISNAKAIRAIAGGMHLGSASAGRVARTIESLRELNIENIWPCHCTEATATAQLMAAFGEHCRPCNVGTRIDF